MATLKERYEELFGPTPDYDPISIEAPELAERGRRRALNIQGAAPTASPRRALPPPPAPAQESVGGTSGQFITGIPKVVAEPLLGTAEYLSRQVGADSATDVLQGARDSLEGWRESVYARMNPEVIDMAGREIMTLDPDRTIWRGGPGEVAEAIWYKVVEQTPSLLATLIPGALMMRAGAMGKGITYLSASEAGISLGAIQNEIADGVNDTSTEELMGESVRFQELMQEYGDEVAARRELIREAQGMAPLIGGVAVGAISAAAGRYLEPVFTPSGLGFGQRVGRTAISEGLIQEGPQESIEQVASNIAAAVYDGDRDILEGVAESYAQGALLGSIMGAGVGGILGGGKDTPDDGGTDDTAARDIPFRGSPTGEQGELGLTGAMRTVGESTRVEADDLFANISPNQPVPDDIASAIQANLRRDDMMRDMFSTTGDRDRAAAAEQFGPQGTPTRGGGEIPGAGRTPVQPAGISGVPGFQEPVQDEMFPTGVGYGGEQPTYETRGGMVRPVPQEIAPRPDPERSYPVVQEGQGPRRVVKPNVPPGQTAEMFPETEDITRVRDLDDPNVRPEDSRMQGYLMPDQPVAEPEGDIVGQIQDMRRGNREGVYLAPDQPPLPEGLTSGLIVEENFDGKGGTMLFADQAVRDYAIGVRDRDYGVRNRKQRKTLTLKGRPEAPVSDAVMQQLIGELTGAGTGKPADGRFAVQRLDENGAVVQESLVATEEEANDLANAWGDSRVLTAEDAIARRGQTDLWEYSDEVEGETGTEPRKLTGRQRVRFTDDAGQVIEDRTFSDPKRAEKYADQLADEYQLAQPDADARITVTPVRTLPKRKTQPTQDEQAKKVAARKRQVPEKTAGEEVAEEIRKRVPFDERQEMTSAVAKAGSREEAAGNLMMLAAKQLDTEKAKSIDGYFPPEVYEFGKPLTKRQQELLSSGNLPKEARKRLEKQVERNEQLKQDYADAFQELYAQDFIIKNKDAIPLEWRGTAISKAQRDKKKALTKIKTVLRGGKPRRRVDKIVREAKRTDAAKVAQLEANSDRIAELLDTSIPTQAQQDALDIIGATQTLGASYEGTDLPTGGDEEFNAADEDLMVNKDTTKEEVWAMSMAELEVAFDDILNWRARVNQRLTPEKIAEKKAEMSGEAGKMRREIMRGIVSMNNSEETDARVKSSRVVTNVTRKTVTKGYVVEELNEAGKVISKTPRLKTRKEAEQEAKAMLGETRIVETTSGGFTPTITDTKALTSVTRKADESDKAIEKREAEAKKLYEELRTNLRAAIARLKSFQYTVDETGNPTSEGVDELMGAQWAESMVELGRTMVELGRSDAGATKLAKKVNTTLKRIARESNEKLFGAEFASAARQTLKVGGESTVAGRKVSSNRRQLANKIEEMNKKTKAAANATSRRAKWKKDTDYRTFVEPVIKKFAASYYNGQGSYYPTLNEALQLQWILSRWRQQGRNEDFATPIQKMLGDLGFKFVKDTNEMIVKEHKPGQFEFTPKDAHLLNTIRRGDPIPVTATVRPVTAKPLPIDKNKKSEPLTYPQDLYSPKTIRTPRPQGELDQRIQEREKRSRTTRAAEAEELIDVRHIRATQIFAAFRKITDNKKSTIRKLVMAEDKFLRELNTEGFITQMGSELATIRFPHRWTKTGGWVYKTITFRRSASQLWAEQITKGDARKRYSAIRKDYTITKARVADRTATAGKPFTAEDLRWQDAAETFEDKYGQVYETLRQEISEHGEAITTAASTLGDLLNDRTTIRDSKAIIGALVDVLPASSFYGNALRTLQGLDMQGVTVSYDWTNRIKTGETAAKYFGKAKIVLLSRQNIEGSRNKQAAAIHAVTHELMHAATLASMDADPTLTLYADTLRQTAIDNLPAGVTAEAFYGLADAKEFVAEAFSNPNFQSYLKTVRVDNDSLWQRFRSFVKRALGLDEAPQFDNAFDAIMAVEAQLFEKAGLETTGDVVADARLMDKAGQVLDKLKQTYEIETRARKKATAVSSVIGKGKLSHPFHSMRQLRERYEKYMGGKTGPLAQYMDAFNGRNARNNKLMQVPEKMSRKWTEMSSTNPEAALAFSRLGTTATMHTMDPSLSATHKRNIKSAKNQKALFDQLRNDYRALPQEWKDLWRDVTQYYQTSLEEEVNLMTLNAIRGVVTGGTGAMPIEVFNRKYNKDNIRKYTETQQDIMDEFGEYFGEDVKGMASFVQRVANVPAMSQGVYFPLMRYGDYAVYAKNVHDRKYFKDNKAAYEYAAKQRAKDPTLTANTKEENDGRWSVEVVETEFVTAESVTEAMEERDRLIELYGEDNVGDVGKKLDHPQESTISSNAALTSIIESLADNPAAQNAIKQFYLKTLSDQSFRKREIKRQNRRGVNYDLQHRNFANYAKQSSYYRAQLEFGWKMAKGLSDMREYLKGYKQAETIRGLPKEQLDNVYETLKKRDDVTSNPIEINKMVRGGVALTQFYMLTSASYHMINMTQPWMVTLPTMAGRHGWSNAFFAMKRAQALVKAPIFQEVKASKGGLKLLPWLRGNDASAERAFGVFDEVVESLEKNDPQAAEHIAMLEKLRETSVLEVSPLTELREIATGKDKWTTKVLDSSRAMAHMVEVNNRIVSAIAAYDLEYAAQIKAGAGPEAAGAATEAAIAYAEDMVSQTQFDYSTANKPPAFLKYPIIFQFMQWSQHINAHLVRNLVRAYRGDKDAAKILAGVLGTHALAAGAIGVTLQPVKMAFGMAMMALGDEDEPYTVQNALSGKTFDRAFASATNELFGTTVSTVLSRGLPAGLGFDLSTRMSMGTLFFIDLRGDTPESVAGSLLGSFGGAAVNQGLTFYRGVQYIGSGDYVKAMEAFSPKFLRDILRAGRFSTDGLVNRSGDTVLDTSDLGFYEVALQAVGFTPTGVGKFYEGQSAIKDKERYVRDRKIRLLKEFRTAPWRDRREIIARIGEFNRAFPQEAIDSSSLKRNVKGKYEREAQYKRYGAAIDDKKASLYKGYGEPYR